MFKLIADSKSAPNTPCLKAEQMVNQIRGGREARSFLEGEGLIKSKDGSGTPVLHFFAKRFPTVLFDWLDGSKEHQELAKSLTDSEGKTTFHVLADQPALLLSWAAKDPSRDPLLNINDNNGKSSFNVIGEKEWGEEEWKEIKAAIFKEHVFISENHALIIANNYEELIKYASPINITRVYNFLFTSGSFPKKAVFRKQSKQLEYRIKYFNSLEARLSGRHMIPHPENYLNSVVGLYKNFKIQDEEHQIGKTLQHPLEVFIKHHPDSVLTCGTTRFSQMVDTCDAGETVCKAILDYVGGDDERMKLLTKKLRLADSISQRGPEPLPDRRLAKRVSLLDKLQQCYPDIVKQWQKDNKPASNGRFGRLKAALGLSKKINRPRN